MRHHAPGGRRCRRPPPRGTRVSGCHRRQPGSGIVYNEANLRRAYARAGYATVAEETGTTLNYDTGYQTVSYPEGAVMKQFSIITPAIEADAIVVVSKAKTHMWTRMTGATKNLFGLIPGLEKPVFHFRFQDEYAFGRMLVDLNECMKPRLQVMDAVMAMEGDGPQAGSPRKVGVVLAGSDPAAVDTVLARLIGMDPLEVGTIRSAAARGLIDPATVRTVGDDPADLAVPTSKTLHLHRGRGGALAARGPRPHAAVREDLRPTARRGRGGMHRMWEVRADLPGARGHRHGGEGGDRPFALHQVLLLP